MSIIQNSKFFVLIIILTLIVFLVSLYDVFYEQGWLLVILTFYGLFIISLILMLISIRHRQTSPKDIVQEFEKTLEGPLSHFQCPTCGGMFALKKSKYNNKKSFTMTCPDCGAMGEIVPHPKKITASVPSQKSENIKFQCSNCGERVSLWAEGSTLHSTVDIQSCPYCGVAHGMKTI